MSNINLKLSKKVFNEVYLPYLFDYSKRIEVYYGGAGSGKSHFITCKIIARCCNQKREVLVIRKTLASQRDSCWALFNNVLKEWGLYSYIRVNKSNYTIEFPNGSKITFKGLDSSEKIKSIITDDLFVEEATELTQTDFEQLELRIRSSAPDLQIYVAFNPISKQNWCYKRWFSESAVIPDNTLILKTTYKDNKFLPEEYITSLEKMIDTNPVYYKIYALGEFCSLSKLVYNNWKVEEFDHTQIKGNLCIGLDFGFVNDKTALICSIIDGSDLYIFKEYTCIGKTNDEIYAAIAAMGLHKSTIIADSAEPKSVEELKRAGCIRIRESKKGPDSIIHGIQKLQQYQIHVHPNCKETIIELENYSWQIDKQTNEYINKPLDEWNHCLDALRYSLQCMQTNKLRTASKITVGF